MKGAKGYPRNPLALELQRTRERLKSLRDCFEISGLINSTLEINEVLERIMITSRTILKADACSLFLVDDQTQELVIDVAQGPVADKLEGEFRLKKGEGIAGRVFESGEAQVIEDAYDDSHFHPDFDRKTGYRTRSVLCVPLKTKDRIVGVFQVINKVDGTPFNSDDVETLTLLSNHAAIAIENARMHRELLHKQRIESDLAYATSIQLSFLPREVPKIERFRFHAHYKPAMEVGGDFYDFIPLQDRHLGILIGDVSGKGIAAALYMARLTSDFRFQAIRQRDPIRTVEQINDLLCERSQRGMFASAVYLVLDTAAHRVTCVNAGHLSPVLWNHAQDRFSLLRHTGGPPLGIVPAQIYTSSTFDLCSGDCLMLATDGLIEARNSNGDLFGWDRLEEVVRTGGSGVEGIYRRVMQAMEGFLSGHPQWDDMTAVFIGVEEA